MLDEFFGHRARHDVTGHFAYDEFVRCHFTAHDGRAQAPAALDRDHRWITGRRTAREHHARRARIHHALDDHAHRDLRFGEVEPQAIAHGLDAVETRPAGA